MAMLDKNVLGFRRMWASKGETFVVFVVLFQMFL